MRLRTINDPTITEWATMHPASNELNLMEEGNAGFTEAETSAPVLEKSPTTTSSTSSSSFWKSLKPTFAKQCIDDAEGASQRAWRPSLEAAFLSALKRLPERKSNRTPVVRSLEQCNTGYPKLAAFLDSDEAFMMYRRFGFLQARLLLDKQEGLRQLERKLDKMDKRDSEKDPTLLQTRDLDEEDARPRRELLETIDKKFREYAETLSAAQQLMAFNRPAASDYRSVVNFITNEGTVCEDDASWIYCKEDMITLRAGREHAWLDDWIEKLLRWFHCGLIEYIFCSEETKLKSENDNIVYYTRSRIDSLVNAIIVAIILALLVIPIYVLWHVINGIDTPTQDAKAYAICIGVLLVFTMAFSAVLSLFTRAKRHEILGAAAAYCAVLVVFLGNLGPHGQN